MSSESDPSNNPPTPRPLDLSEIPELEILDESEAQQELGRGVEVRSPQDKESIPQLEVDGELDAITEGTHKFPNDPDISNLESADEPLASDQTLNADEDLDADEALDPDELPGEETGGKRRVLYCFNCNRNEGFYAGLKPRWYYSILVGLTLGLICITGPFRCRCCGHRRYWNPDWLHPFRWFPNWK